MSALLFSRTCLRESILPNFTNCNSTNPRARRADYTVNFRKSLLIDEIKTKENLKKDLEKKLINAKLDFLTACRTSVADHFLQTIEEIKKTEEKKNFTKISRKLNSLYNGTLIFPSAKKSFYNLSNVTLSTEQEEVLNLGMNFHIATNFDPYLKKCQIENLHQQLLKIEKKQEGGIS